MREWFFSPQPDFFFMGNKVKTSWGKRTRAQACTLMAGSAEVLWLWRLDSEQLVALSCPGGSHCVVPPRQLAFTSTVLPYDWELLETAASSHSSLRLRGEAAAAAGMAPAF